MSDNKVATNINAIKIHLILLNVATGAAQYRLAELIRQKDSSTANSSSSSNFVENFLKTSYQHNRLDKEFDCFVRCIKNYFGKKKAFSHPLPHHNPMQIFDISACYNIVKSLLNSSDLRYYEELKTIRNKYYAHLNSLEIDEVTYANVLERLKVIVDKLSEHDEKAKLENQTRITQIEKIKDLTYLDKDDKDYLKIFYTGLIEESKDVFRSSRVVNEKVECFLEKYEQNQEIRAQKEEQFHEDFEKMLNMYCQASKEFSDEVIDRIADRIFAKIFQSKKVENTDILLNNGNETTVDNNYSPTDNKVYNITSSIPYARREFTCELVDFRNIQDLLSEKQFFLLYGESGCGKTSLALEYAYKMKDEMQDWNVQWFNASSKNKLFNDLFTLYEKLGGKITKNKDVTFSLIADYIKCEFSKVKEKNFLFVLDNLIESITWTDEFIRTMPENIRVLVTSTNGLSLCKYENELSRIEVNCLSQENRETFVKVKFQIEITQQDLKLLENFLCYDLHLLSLCLKRDSSWVLAEVLDDKENFHLKMLEEIRKIISREAWSLLECFGYIDSDAIPEVLIGNLLDKAQINDAINCLVNLRLAELFVNRNHKCLRIDRKTQYLMRRFYTNENTEKYVAHILFKVMPKIENYVIQDEIWDKAVILINHLEKMYRDSALNKQNDLKAGNEIYAGLQEKISRYNFYVRMGV